MSETLREVYSSDWDGHQELETIVGVRAAGQDCAWDAFSSPLS